MSPATPTISTACDGSENGPVVVPNQTRLPIGLSHGQNAREQATNRGWTGRGRIPRTRGTHPERQHIVGHKSGSTALDAREALDQQPRGGEQQARDRNLADDQRRKRAAPSTTAAIVLLQCRCEI